jgi:alpha-galactosidase
MKMKLIQVDEASKKFLLRVGDSSYAFGVNAAGTLTSLHWGGVVERLEDLPSPRDIECYRHRCPRRASMDLQEYPAWGGEFFGEPALKVDFPDGVRTSILKYSGCSVKGDELVVTLKDYGYPLEVALHYKVWKDSSLLARHAVITNKGVGALSLKSALSASFHLPRTGGDYRLSHLAGRWGGEYMIKRQAVPQGKIVLENRTGLSTTFQHPFFALDEGGACENAGRVWFGTLLHSGVWKIAVEQNPYEETCVTGGVSDMDFSWPLKPGESFTTPSFLCGVSDEGFGGASRALHKHQRKHIAPESESGRIMPVLFNSWASMGVAVDEEKILEVAGKAAGIGAELFVIDDGWQDFLGDWNADPAKFPKGLRPIIEKVKALGMDFGLWVEVESFETKSRLYKEHPEWAMSFPGREIYKNIREDVGRCSVLLNFAREDVADYILQTLRRLVRETGISYLKLDMNCLFTNPGWDAAPEAERQTIWVKYADNIHKVFGSLKREFPKLLIENCAAGGGRGDLAMDAIFGRMNRSDNQDTLDILKFHEGFTWLHLSKMAGGACHISDACYGINLRQTPLKMQAFAGMLGSLAIGKNLPKCPQAELDEIASYVKLHKSLRHVAQLGDLYRVASIYDKPYAAFEFVSPDKAEALLFVFGQSMQFAFKAPPFKLEGLDPKRIYAVECIGGRKGCEGYNANPEGYPARSGQALKEIGVRVELLGDYDAQIIHLKARD